MKVRVDVSMIANTDEDIPTNAEIAKKCQELLEQENAQWVSMKVTVEGRGVFAAEKGTR